MGPVEPEREPVGKGSPWGQPDTVPSEVFPGPLCPDTNHIPALLCPATQAPELTSGSHPFQLWDLELTSSL